METNSNKNLTRREIEEQIIKKPGKTRGLKGIDV